MALFDFLKKQASKDEFQFDEMELNKIENFFNYLVQAYYQAYGITKGYKSSGVFGNIETQPELQGFRQHVKEKSVIISRFYNGKDNAQSAIVDISIIKLKLKKSFSLGADFVTEIEKSVDQYVKKSNDMTSYRVMFQQASDTLYPMVADTIQLIDSSISKKQAIESVVESIISENFWQGNDVVEMVEIVRSFENELGYSKTWLKQYAFHWITN